MIVGLDASLAEIVVLSWKLSLSATRLAAVTGLPGGALPAIKSDVAQAFLRGEIVL